MEATIVIAAAIAAYSAWVIYRKYKQYKAGNFCGCGCGSCSCSGCASKGSCGKLS